MRSTRGAAFHPSAAGDAYLRTAVNPFIKTPSLPQLFLILSLILLVQVQPASAHPQCLDFEPPFKPPWHLEFCTQYEEFGCCDQKTDNTIAERYWDIIDQLDEAGYDLCADLLKEVMCQVKYCAYTNALLICVTKFVLKFFFTYTYVDIIFLFF